MACCRASSRSRVLKSARVLRSLLTRASSGCSSSWSHVRPATATAPARAPAPRAELVAGREPACARGVSGCGPVELLLERTVAGGWGSGAADCRRDGAVEELFSTRSADSVTPAVGTLALASGPA